MSSQGPGARPGARRGARRRRSFRPRLLALALVCVALVVAWGFLVRSAIDFGTMARGGDSQAWAFLGISSLGAAACLFLGLLLLVRLLRAMGVLRRRTPSRHGSSKHAR